MRSVVTEFERIATRCAVRVAISSGLWQPTYRELNEAANRLAHRLIDAGVGLCDRTAILMSHDSPLVAAIVGGVKAGQIVVVLDPGDPRPRLKALIEDTEPSAIVTDAANSNLAAEIVPPGCRIVNFQSESAEGPVENPSVEIPPDQAAILTYTSGSTGRPKAVMRTHQQLLRSASVHTDAMQSTEKDSITLLASISTAQGMSFLWWILLNGATICPFPVRTTGVTGLAEWMIDRRVTVYGSSASIFRTWVKTLDASLMFPDVRLVWLGSEGIDSRDFSAFQKHFPSTSVLVHGFSSSETSIIAWSRWKHDDVVPDGLLPVGHFARDIDVSIIGDDGQPVVQGEVGEIVVKTRHVVGYWRDPALSAERFSADLDGKGTRLVRTGDFGRINADGLLELRGRRDDRVKIRGNRIELGEIDRTLENIPGVERAAAVSFPRKNHEPMLVAFVVKTGDASLTASRLRHTVRTSLPVQMVPSRIVFLDSLPYNRGNKIDRDALRRYVFPDPVDQNSDEPRTETEVLLANIWSESLELPHVGRHDDFFDLGGDSLKAAVVAAQVHAAIRVELSLGMIADHPTISALAAYIDEQVGTGAAGTPPIVRCPRAEAVPLSLYQEYHWPYRETPLLTHLHKCRITGPLDIEIYKQCLLHVIDRHEILRTTFQVVDGRPTQVVHQSAPFDFTFIDLAGHTDPDGQADAIFRDTGSKAIDVETLPIMRHVLIRVAENQYRMARVVSTMISDGFSSRIIDAELAVLYEARLQGRAPPLPRQAPLQYADYAVWQRNITQRGSRHLTEASDWWTDLLSIPPPATRLPFRRLLRRANLDVSEGIIGWTLAAQTSTRLDEVARSVGTTPFVIRLAAFVALIADVAGNRTVALWTLFDNRHRADAQNIAGPLVNIVPLVFSFDPTTTFRQWLEIVHGRLFEILAHSELPFEKIKEQLRTVPVDPPNTDIMFMMSRDNSDQQFGGLSISSEPFTIGAMPMGCTFCVDAQKPENCQARFDANNYERKDVSALVDCYLLLLETGARKPDLPMGTILTMLNAKPRRWAYKKYAEPIYDSLLAVYAASPLLKSFWRPLKRRLLPHG